MDTAHPAIHQRPPRRGRVCKHAYKRVLAGTAAFDRGPFLAHHRAVRSPRVLSAFLLVLAVPWACSEFKGAADDGGADDGASGDDAATIDGASDGAVTDGATGGDGATSDGPSGDGATARVCTAAACPPVVMADDLHVPFVLAVNGTHLYWLERGNGNDLDGELVRIAKTNPCVHADAGCRGVLDGNVAGQTSDFVTLGLGPADVCYTETYNAPAQHSLNCISLSSGQKRAVFQGNGAGGNLAVLADAIYWANYGTSAAASNGAILRVAEDAGFTASPPAVASNRPGPDSVAVEGANVFWSEVGATDGGGALYRAFVDGGARTAIAPGQHAPRPIALYGNQIYWADLRDGTIKRVNKDGSGTVETLASGQASPFTVVVDASGVYWATAGSPPDYLDGTVMQHPLGSGTSATQVVGSVSSLAALVADANYLYYASMGTTAGSFTDGKVFRIAKTY